MKKTMIGIAAAVVIFWLTQGLYSWLTKPKPPDPKTSFFFDGRVIDINTRQLLSGAVVSMRIPNVTIPPDNTDSEGRFLFTLQDAAQPVAGLLTVSARGYQMFSKHIQSNAAGAFDPVPDILLHPEPSNQAANLPAVQATRMATAVKYTPRALNTAVRIPALRLTR